MAADDGDPANNIGEDSVVVTIDNVAPTVGLSGADEVDEGDIETYTYTVSDPGVDDTFSVDSGFPDCDFGATNNGVLVGTPVQTAAGGSFVCKFPDGDKSATVKIKVTDNDGGSSTDSADVVVVDIANVAPEVTAAADQSSDEGESKSFDLGSFTDAGDDADWDSVSTGAMAAPTRLRRARRARWAACSTPTRTARRTTWLSCGDDKDGALDSATFTVSVANVAPVVTLTGAGSADEGDTVTYTYTVADVGDDPDPDIDESCGDEGDYVDTPAPDSFDCMFPDRMTRRSRWPPTTAIRRTTSARTRSSSRSTTSRRR